MIGLCVVGGLCIGGWRGAGEIRHLSGYDYLYGFEITIRGTVAEDPGTTKTGDASLRLRNISYDGRELPGTLWVSIGDDYPVQRSDIVTVRGELNEGFGAFSGSMYRAEIEAIERPQPGDVALRVRNWFADMVREHIEEPFASLGLGYLLGQRRDLPPELDDALRIAGLTHVVVASGYNLTILVRLSRRLFMRISRFTAFAASGGMVLSFAAITGASPSMSRAGLVTGLSLLAWYYGRRFHPVALLSFAAAVTVLVNPFYVWGDVGWQLSFAAFAGVMIGAPLAQAYFFGNKKPGVVRQIIGETTAAQLFTLPILLATFGAISNVALIANILVLPLVPLAMLLTFLVGVCHALLPWLASIIALPTSALLEYMTSVAAWLSSVSWAMNEVEISWWFVPAFYILLAAVCWWMKRATGYRLSDSSIVE